MIKIPKNCKFYHVQEIQGLDKPTKGPFDLRKNIYQLLGNCDYKNKSVLELGPASGFITFFLENLGAKVSCIDLSIKNDEWDTIPHVNVNWKKNTFHKITCKGSEPGIRFAITKPDVDHIYK